MSLTSRIQAALWDRQDAQMRAAGFTVETTKGSRGWSRTYRHPQRIALAQARAAAAAATPEHAA